MQAGVFYSNEKNEVENWNWVKGGFNKPIWITFLQGADSCDAHNESTIWIE